MEFDPADRANQTSGFSSRTRMISSQNRKEFTESHYEKIKDGRYLGEHESGKQRNTITRYYVEEENLVGKVKEEKRNYDLLTAVMICILALCRALDEAGVLLFC